MPAKKNTITDEERAKRIRETARKIETDDDPEKFDRTFRKIAMGDKVKDRPNR